MVHALLHYIIKGWLYVRFNITTIGRENVPADEAIIVVSPHRTVLDSYLLPAVVGRTLFFMAKEEYFTKPGVTGKVMKWILSHGAIPVNRESAMSKVGGLNKLQAKLLAGFSVGLHPEGTRTPTRNIYKGWDGAVGMARKSGKKILPVVILGLDTPRRLLSRPKITVIIGEPMSFAEAVHTTGILSIFPIHKIPLLVRAEKEVQTRRLMLELAEMTGWDYIDEHADVVKKRMLAELAQDE